MIFYDLTELSLKLGLTERFFLTRENGFRAYPLLKEQLTQISQGEALVLNFPLNQLIDSSFADETIIRLGEEILSGQIKDRALLLQSLTEDSITNIESIISLRNMKLAFLAVEQNGQWRCIGHLDRSLNEVLEILGKSDSLTATQLANSHNLAINTASNRLKRLYDRGLIRREYEVSEKGLQYIYYFWQWT
jgi:DNA-binding transcriptional ArsR family regulator